MKQFKFKKVDTEENSSDMLMKLVLGTKLIKYKGTAGLIEPLMSREREICWYGPSLIGPTVSSKQHGKKKPSAEPA